jgi:hypothetical protein
MDMRESDEYQAFKEDNLYELMRFWMWFIFKICG